MKKGKVLSDRREEAGSLMKRACKKAVALLRIGKGGVVQIFSKQKNDQQHTTGVGRLDGLK